MSSSPTAATSTTRSSSSCSSPRKEGHAGGRAARPAADSAVRPLSPTLSPTVAVIACGALGGHIREITERRGWPVELHHLPSLLHNHPERIAPAAQRLAARLQARGLPLAPAYPDSGTSAPPHALSPPLRLPPPPPL